MRLLLAIGLALGATAILLPPIGFAPVSLIAARLLLGIVAASLCRGTGAPAAAEPSWRLGSDGVLVATFALCLVTGLLAGTVWPNSGDEYSDVVLADTLAGGHYATVSPADTLLLRTFHLLDFHGRRFSIYSPGWPLFLAPFRALGLDALAPAGLAACLGLALRSSMRSLGIGRAAEGPALALVLLTPFTLFNGASLFPHMLAAALSAWIVAWQLVDEARPAGWRKLLIGAAFGWLFVTRHEAAAVLGFAYAADRLCYRRGGALGDGILIGLGALPWLAWQAQYDTALTGSAFLEPLALGTPELHLGLWGNGYNGPHSPMRAIVHILQWSAGLACYGGWLVMSLLPSALAARLAQRRLRFFDAVLPLTILFFMIFPDDGGHQYGPRYWFAAWPLAILTLTAGLAGPDGALRLGGRRLSWNGIAVRHLALAAGAWLTLVPSVRLYVETRKAVFEARPDVLPAVVLVPGRLLKGGLWVDGTREQEAGDFTRNAPGFASPVLYGRGDLPDSLERACRLPGRAVFLWREDTAPMRLPCPPSGP